MSPSRSIQGEQQETRASATLMNQAEVDRYVDSADDRVLTCRERGRHPFPSIREAGLRFEGVSSDGLLIRRIQCPSCGLARRMEFWDVRQKGNRITRCELVEARTEYKTERLTDGTVRSYTAPPGHGRITPKQVRNAVGTSALAGHSYRNLIRAARKAERDQQRSLHQTG
jgi:hypothetical protein